MKKLYNLRARAAKYTKVYRSPEKETIPLKQNFCFDGKSPIFFLEKLFVKCILLLEGANIQSCLACCCVRTHYKHRVHTGLKST